MLFQYLKNDLGLIGLIISSIVLLSICGCNKNISSPPPAPNDTIVTLQPDILYTELIPDSVTVGTNAVSEYDLDLNKDGKLDFSFTIFYDTFYCGNQLGKDILVQVSPAPQNEIAASDSFPNAMDTFEIINSSLAIWSPASNQVLVHNRAFYGFVETPPPPPLPPDSPIIRKPPRRGRGWDMPASVGSSPVVITNGDSCETYNIGKWQNFSYNYVGLKLVSGGHTYYGWVGLSLDFVSGSFIIYDYAYNRNPDQEIHVGQTR